MKWKHIPLKKVAPSMTPNLQFEPYNKVWHLTLDQIESDTGTIIDKQIRPAAEAGTSTYIFDERNVLYSKLRPYLNKVVCPEEEGIATTELIPLRPNPIALDRKFLTYFLRSKPFVRYASSITAGTKMPRVIMSKFWEYKIPLPPLSEQRQIVEILDQADRLRKLRLYADTKAARILPTLFYKMFGDPATNPMEWEVKPLGELSVCRPQYGANAKAIDYLEKFPRYVRITDIANNGRLRNENVKTIDMDNWEPYKLADGDLLFARSGATVGKTYMYRPQDGLCVFAGYLIRFKLDLEQLEPWVAFAFTHTSYYQSWIASKKRAAAQPNINGQEYAALPMIRPEKNLQKKFAKVAERTTNLTQQNLLMRHKINNLFESILHFAFAGDLTASWRKAHMKELLQEMELQAKALAS